MVLGSGSVDKNEIMVGVFALEECPPLLEYLRLGRSSDIKVTDGHAPQQGPLLDQVLSSWAVPYELLGPAIAQVFNKVCARSRGHVSFVLAALLVLSAALFGGRALVLFVSDLRQEADGGMTALDTCEV